MIFTEIRISKKIACLDIIAIKETLIEDIFFSERVPNNLHCACLSNKSLSYYWVAYILRHRIYIYIYIYIVFFGPVKPELGVIPSGQEIIHE